MGQLKEFTNECTRVLRITKKPDSIEFKTITKVSGIGILLIGFIGFLLYLISKIVTNMGL